MKSVIGLLVTLILVAAMVLVWSLCKIYDAKTAQKNNKKDVKPQIPMARWLVGALLGAFLSYSSAVNTLSFNDITLIRETKLPYLFYFICLLIIGAIPMIIAYKKNIKNANAVYWLSFASMCAPAGVIWFIVSLMMALFGKAVNENKSNKSTISVENRESKKVSY